MTRVAYVCADPGVPVFGRKGCSVHVQEVIRALLRVGCEVDLFARSVQGPPPSDLTGVHIHALPALTESLGERRESELLAANQSLLDVLDDAGTFDFVYERYSLWSHAAMEWATAHHTPGLLEINAPLIEEQIRYRRLTDRGAAEQSTRRALRAASAILAVSSEVADRFQHFPEALERIHVVPNGVDARRFGATVQPEIALPFDRCTFGFVGTLKPWHGVELLIEAAAVVEGARLLIVGDGPERVQLEHLACKRGFDPSAVFVGAVDPVRIPGLLASMQVAVAPYPRLDGFYFSPLKILEYMAAGLPIIASDIGQIGTIIVHDHTGLLAAPGEVASLVSNMQRMRDDVALRERLGSCARDAAVRDHSWDGVATRIMALARESKRCFLDEAEACR